MTALEPRWYQLEDARTIRSRRKLLSTHKKGMGKCLRLGTPIIKFDGSIVPVEQINVGDFLLGPDGGKRQVLSMATGVEELVWIVPTKGAPWGCTLDHVLVLTHTSTQQEWEITVEDFLLLYQTHQKYLQLFFPANGVDFSEVYADLPIDPYFVGLWLGDGTKNLGTVSVTKPDQEIKDYLEEIAEQWGVTLRSTTDKACPTHFLVTERGKPNPLLNAMRQLFGRDVERFPQQYLVASLEDRAKLFAGLLDTDGSFSFKTAEFVQKRKVIADACEFLARSLGFRVLRTVKLVKGEEYHRLRISGDFSKIPLRIKRKQQEKRLQRKRVNVTGFRVEPAGEGTYVGFTLDGDGRFLLGDFTVTHNSEIATLAISMPGEERLLPALVACPIHSTTEWQRHIQNEFPNDRVIIAAELPPDEKVRALAEPADWYIVNHAMLATPTKSTSTKRNFYKMPKGIRSLVIDESHYKGLGRKSRAWAGARTMADWLKGGIVLPMTGTPVRRVADDLWAELRLVDRTLTSYWRFVYAHCKVEETPWNVEILGAKESMWAELASRSVSRTYQEVGLLLPDLIEHETPVELTPATARAYQTLKNDLIDEHGDPVFSAAAAVAKLRHLTAKDPNKLAALKSATEDLDQFIVFTYYHETSDLLAPMLKAKIIDGRLPGKKRAEVALSSPRIIAGIDALASTLDLSHHRDVIWYEETYEPGTMENALGRVQRWRKSESDEPISNRAIYAKGTMDSRIHLVTKGRAVDMNKVTERRLLEEEIFGR